MTARMGEMPVCAPAGLPIRGQPRDYEYGFASCWGVPPRRTAR